MRRVHSIRGGGAVALLVTLVIAVACGQPTAPQGNAAQGQGFWARSACVGCHGPNAEGSASGPALADTPLPLTDFQHIVRRGGPGMPKYLTTQVSDQDLENLYAWLEAGASVLTAGQSTPTTALTNGQAAWTQSACAGCHGASAEGGSGPGLAGTPRSFAEFQRVVRRGAGGMPPFSATQISDQTLQVIYTWLQSQTAAQPQNPWVQAGCAGCHGPNAEGGRAPSLAGERPSFAEFQRVVRSGAEGMPSYSTSQISDQDLESLYNWLLSLP